VCIVFLELEGRGPLGELAEVHVKEIYGKFTVKVAEFVLPVFSPGEPFREFLKISYIVRAVVIYAFMDMEMFPVFYGLKGMAAVRALELQRGDDFSTVDEGLLADLAFELPATAGIIVNELVWCTAERAYGIFRDRTFFPFLRLDRRDRFTIAETVILIPELPVLFDEWLDHGKFIREELLVLGTMELIMSPLFKGNISANKKNEPADLLILFLNDFK